MSRRFILVRGETILGVVTVAPNESDFPRLANALAPLLLTWMCKRCSMSSAGCSMTVGSTSGRGNSTKLMAPGVKMVSLAGGDVTKVTGLNISGNRVSWR